MTFLDHFSFSTIKRCTKRIQKQQKKLKKYIIEDEKV